MSEYLKSTIETMDNITNLLDKCRSIETNESLSPEEKEASMHSLSLILLPSLEKLKLLIPFVIDIFPNHKVFKQVDEFIQWCEDVKKSKECNEASSKK